MKLALSYILILAAAGRLQGARPAITNLAFDTVTHSSVRITWDTDIPAYFQVKFGVVRRTYPYASISNGPATKVSVAIGGLKPGTTYFMRPASRPNANDDTEICETNLCGAVELMITTLPEPSIHPELPLPPADPYRPTHPDASGYSVIPLRVADNGECVSARDGSGLQAVINNASFGTVIEFPQGATCKVFPRNPITKIGYSLPAKALDPQAGGDVNSPNHRWIIFRTAGSAGDFPPEGVRMTPAWSGKLAKLVAQEPSPAESGRGQVFEAGNEQSHHYWIENLEFTHTSDPSVFPPDAFDPRPFHYLIRILSTYNVTHPAEYIVLDRIYVHGTGFPGRLMYGVGLDGDHQALLNSWIGPIDYWRVYQWATTTPTVSADKTQLLIPKTTIRRNARDPETGMQAAATATLNAPSTYSGRFVGYLGPDGLTIQYTTGGATIDCAGCSATTSANPLAPYNRYYFFGGAIANGKFTITGISNANYSTSAYSALGSYAVLFFDGGKGPYTVSNNYIDGYGIGFYNDAGGAVDTSPTAHDVIWERNRHVWDRAHLATSPETDGFWYLTRDQWETKRGRQWLVNGNIFEGGFAGFNNGIPVFFSSRPTYSRDTPEQGLANMAFTNNIIRHAAAGFSCQGMSGGPDPPIANRMLFANNLLYDIDEWTYDANSPNGRGHLMENIGGCQDMTVRNNTFGLNIGRGPYQLFEGVFGQLAEGMKIVDNAMYMSYHISSGQPLGGIHVDDNQPVPSHPRAPAIKNGTDKEKLDSYSVRIGTTVEPNYTYANNVIVGGILSSGPWYGKPDIMRDMNAKEVAYYSSGYPPGNAFPTGNTRAEREAEVKFADVANYNYRLQPGSPYRFDGTHPATNGGSVGVNYDELEQAIGLVTKIAPVQAGSSAAVLSYIAPDGNACSVDTSADGVAWARISDGGGARARAAVAFGLRPSMTYRYRILCYYEQINDARRLEDYPADQITNGEFQTTATSEEVIRVQIGIPTPPGAGSRFVAAEYGSTALLGGSTEAIRCDAGCSASIMGVKGAGLFYRLKYLDDQGAVVGYSDVQGRIVR